MSIEINGHRFRLLIDSSQISKKVVELGESITNDFKDTNLLIVAVLKGSIVFLADLVRQIDSNTEIEFIRVSSYKDDIKPGEIELLYDISTPLENRDVLLVEDLIDTGASLEFIKSDIMSKNPKSFKICTLIKKNKPRESEVDIDYVGFEIDDQFIVGYGTDFAEMGRNLPEIYVIEDEDQLK